MSRACGRCNVIQMIDTQVSEISGITVTGAPEGASGIYVQGVLSSVIIRGNVIRHNGRGSSGRGGFGIYAREVGDLKIIDNEITANGCTGIGIEGTYPYILHNLFFPQNIDCSRTYEDILIVSGGPSISFNVLHRIAGGLGGVGNYNVDIFGSPVAVP